MPSGGAGSGVSRLLTAGARTPPGQSPAALMKRENQALAQFYGCLADLHLIAYQARPLIAANDRLEPRLNDPALMAHPKRAEYVAAFETRALQIRVLRQKADPFLREFALVWERLPEERREAIRRDETDWPQETNSAVLAARVFAWMCSESFLWPGRAEAGF